MTPVLSRPHAKYEKRLFNEGYQAVAGVDEVGRGAWAGPLIACAVIMPHKPRIYGVRDSKQMVPNKRYEICERLKEKAVSIGIGVVQHAEIDQIGIVQANELAMLRAIQELDAAPDHILIDAFKISNLPIPHSAIAHGDALVYSIAAASIIAKTTRDAMMEQLAEQYPAYGFETNKGYGTDAHRTSLDQHGTCPIHRISFHPMKTMV